MISTATGSGPALAVLHRGIFEGRPSAVTRRLSSSYFHPPCRRSRKGSFAHSPCSIGASLHAWRTTGPPPTGREENPRSDSGHQWGGSARHETTQTACQRAPGHL